MGWWGKVIGGTFGFMLGGPLGALIGAAVGHKFDAGLERQSEEAGGADLDQRERAQTAFFTATFAVMGHMAKADGRVSANEIEIATLAMDRMGLGPEHRRVARELFRDGRDPGFALDEALDQLRQECRGRRDLLRLFVEIQLQAALADGEIHAGERRVLARIGARLGLAGLELEALEAMARAERHFRHQRGAPGTPAERGPSLRDAYAMLNVDPSADDATVKRAYRRLMSQHHPDKLVSKGLPEEMIRVATERTQEIKAAYERIQEARGLQTR
jgi:DnaJ like chaperone protein